LQSVAAQISKLAAAAAVLPKILFNMPEHTVKESLADMGMLTVQQIIVMVAAVVQVLLAVMQAQELAVLATAETAETD
jgi:hypothetical protein